LKRAGLSLRLLEQKWRNQLVYAHPLFEYKLRLEPGDTVDDFDPRGASIEELARALRSPSARVRMRAIITLSARGNIDLNTLLFISSMRADDGAYAYEAGKVYFPAREF